MFESKKRERMEQKLEELANAMNEGKFIGGVMEYEEDKNGGIKPAIRRYAVPAGPKVCYINCAFDFESFTGMCFCGIGYTKWDEKDGTVSQCPSCGYLVCKNTCFIQDSFLCLKCSSA